ncbi:NAD(P)/FAD-dependent oxidoreductase [Prescottella equi]|uniref:NAD(P)/FAD-dependent oxidoreductase n=1 Tax=Rhodococcus hoagii TaxID=43767 RepID=UPI0007CD7654|nr:FAD-dependent oxidoreductase [Prescottella equi]
MSTDRVVIVGAGHAGFAAAVALRECGYEGVITLLDSTAALPYQRPPLSKGFIDGTLAEDAITFRDREYFTREGIDLRIGVSAVSIDRDNRAVLLSDGARVDYTHLMLATGTRPRPLPVPAGAGAFTVLRTLDDARGIAANLATGGRLLVLGGGFIGAEVAATAARRGLDVTVVEAGPQLMGRAVSAYTAQHLAGSLERLGVRVLLTTRVTEVHPGDPATVVTDDGRSLPADHVLAAIGVVPETELAERACLPVDDGIVVDEHLLTCDPAISAIGDCARVVRPDGTSGRIESVQNATDQARCVAARVTGRPHRYDRVPRFWSDQGPERLQIVGHADRPTAEVLRGTPGGGSFSVVRSDSDGRVVAVESINDGRTHMMCRRLFESRAPLAAADLADPDRPLAELLAVSATSERNPL